MCKGRPTLGHSCHFVTLFLLSLQLDAGTAPLAGTNGETTIQGKVRSQKPQLWVIQWKPWCNSAGDAAMAGVTACFTAVSYPLSEALFFHLQDLTNWLSAVPSTRKMVLTLASGVQCWRSVAQHPLNLPSKRMPTPWHVTPASASRYLPSRKISWDSVAPSLLFPVITAERSWKADLWGGFGKDEDEGQ